MSSETEQLGREKLEEMRAVLAERREDLLDKLAEVSELQEWIDAEIEALPPDLTVPRQPDGKRGYTRVEPAQIRRYVQRAGEVGLDDIALGLGVSRGQVRKKVQQLYDAGTLVKTQRDGRVFYRIAKPSRTMPQLRAQTGGSERTPGWKVPSAVAGTSRQRLPKDVADVVARAGERGWSLQMGSGKHPTRLFHAGTGETVVLASTPGDWRWGANLDAELRRREKRSGNGAG